MEYWEWEKVQGKIHWSFLNTASVTWCNNCDVVIATSIDSSVTIFPKSAINSVTRHYHR